MKNNESGFSLVELIVVVVIIGVIAAMAVPYLARAVDSSQNGNIYGTLKSVASTQVSFYSTNNRFARLDELNPLMGGLLGSPSGTDLVKGPFVISMSPNPNPTDAELREEYTITATRQVSGGELPYLATIDQSGRVSDNLFSNN